MLQQSIQSFVVVQDFSVQQKKNKTLEFPEICADISNKR